MGINSKTEKLTALMLSEGRSKQFAKDEVIQSSDTGNSLCLIKSGYVKRYLILNDGNIRVQIIYGPHDIFPLTLAFKKLLDQDLYVGPEVYYYEALCKTEMITLDTDNLAKYIDGDVEYYRDLFSEAGRRLYNNIQRLENLGLPSSYQRVAHEISFYAREFGVKKSLGTRINLPLTQQDLADILSMTRETVSLCMSELKKKNIIKTGKYIFVLDEEALKNEAFG